MSSLRVKCSKEPLLTVKRSKQWSRTKRLVYVLTVRKPLKYQNGRSRIIYIGTTGKGTRRPATSAVDKASEAFGEVRGVREIEAYIVTSVISPLSTELHSSVHSVLFGSATARIAGVHDTMFAVLFGGGLDLGLRKGTYFNRQLTDTVFNGGGTDYWTLGAIGNWRNLEYGVVWARQSNGDIAFVPDPAGGPNPVAAGFSANGVEIYSRLTFGKFAAVLGFEDYIPHDLTPLINPDFKTRYAILGAEWHISKSGYAFFEARLGDSVDAVGNDLSQAAAIGFRYDFSWKTPHTQ